MHLDGVVPNVDTYFRAMFASMQARRLGDALFFWEDMRKHGIVPDVSCLSKLPACLVCQGYRFSQSAQGFCS